MMKFSKCGRLLATAGRDKVVNMWVLRTALPHFQQKREHQNPGESKGAAGNNKGRIWGSVRAPEPR